MTIPQLLTNFRVYGNGNNDMIGVADVELPKLENMTETAKGAGIGGEIEVPVACHYSKMTVKLKYRTITDNAVALSSSKSQQLEIRGAQQMYDNKVGEVKIVPVKVVLRGLPMSLEPGKFEPGKATDTTVEISAEYLKMTLNGKDVIEIDKYNYVAKIGDTDYLADVRSALGL